MASQHKPLLSPTAIRAILLLLPLFTSLRPSLALSPDGALLLSFRYAILSDPLSLLHNWHYSDQSPCSWSGVACSPDGLRVTGLALPNARILGPISPEIGLLDQLRHLDLSGNLFNGTLPVTLFNNSQLQTLSLANNAISGELPASLAGMSSLNVLDLSSNLFNGSLPTEIGGVDFKYLNISKNKFSGGFSPEFGAKWPGNATVDFSFNNLTGQIPEVKSLMDQKSENFAGNPNLCGKPLKNPCTVPSTLSNPPNALSSISPAIAVIPKSVHSGNSSSGSSTPPLGAGSRTGMKPVTIAAIAVADLAGIAVLGLALLYLYQWKKKRAENSIPAAKAAHFSDAPSPPAPTACCCITAADFESVTTEGRASSVSDAGDGEENDGGGGGRGRLVMVDGETEMEMEALMKASAYLLGTSGASIVYKAVVEGGRSFAVRRMGDGGGVAMRRESFESQVRAAAKVRHPNVVRVRGFYWGSSEKLVVSDFVDNGSLASTSAFKRNGSSTCHLSLEVRMKIAKGVARGLTYIHEKKFIHGNLKPSNILLTQEMEPLIGDLGIHWLIYGWKGSGSSHQFGSKRSVATAQHDMGQELSLTDSPYISPMGCTNGPTSPYQAPELLKSLKASPKWDVYSFGVILLELLTGKVFVDREPGIGFEDKYWALRIADVAIRADVQGREEAVGLVFKLGFQCASMVPQKRPSMKEALQVLERILL